MSDKKQENKSGIRLVIPFFLVLGVLTVVSFLIPLRPTRSQMEKRELAVFPEFSWSALAEGSYFDEITTWFSDTFPGREEWLALSSDISSLHGHSQITIAGELPEIETIPRIPEVTEVAEQPREQLQSAEEETVTTAQTEESWGGVDAGDDAAIEMGNGAIIQIGDSAFNATGFSQVCSDKYARSLSTLADNVADLGIRVVSAPAPTAIGILVGKEYQEMLNSADQDATIQYMHDQMNDKVVKVDTYDALVAHNDEYIYFRTDHHWTALGAYYSYEAICEALGMDAVPLEEFQEWDQGVLEGSLYWKAANTRKLKLDNLYTYIPPFDIEMIVHASNGSVRPGDLIQDVTKWNANAKYSAFICSDNPLTIITNKDLPDGPSCVVIKDSFGNALAPFLACNYHKVYVVDYRKYHESSMGWFAKSREVDDIIFAPYVIATQALDGNKMFANLAK